MTEKKAPPLAANGQPAPKLYNYPPVSRTTVHGKASLFFSLPFLCVGAYICLVATKVVYMDPSKIHAPMWVLGAAGSAFFLAGVAVLVHSIAGMRRLARLNAQAEVFPNEPCRADYEWNPEGTESRGNTSLFGHVIGISVVLAMMSIMNWAAFIKDTPLMVAIFAAVFDLIFLAIFVTQVRKAIVLARFGRPTLEYSNFPVRPGELLRVRITGNRDLREATSVVAYLRCVEERYEMQGTGKNRRQVVRSYERYADLIELDTFDARLISKGGIELEFRVPEDAISSALRGRPAIFWDLELHAEVPGIDFKHRFLIPIYDDAPAQPVLEAA